MAVGQRTLQDAVRHLGLEATADNEAAFQIAGQKPDVIVNHTIVKEEIILRMTPRDFLATHGAVVFDLQALYDCFKVICPDFTDQLDWDTGSQAVEFCSRILFEVGPASCQMKKAQGDKTWAFRFPRNEGGLLVTRSVFVSTYKAEGAVY